jgi:hypothetical protein
LRAGIVFLDEGCDVFQGLSGRGRDVLGQVSCVLS